MKTLFLLIILTQNGAGDISASFVNTETLEQCQNKTLMLEAVFTASNIPIVENHCIKSDLRFSKFRHASSSNATRYFYLVKVGNEMVEVEQMPDWRECMTRAKMNTGLDKVYCSSSVQSLQ
ncbi:MAG: hypothetical protein EP297_12210 [Gammaproteobacteria bacterium]|nr:MAG: hypothetical protein EP297_12210 [Gammaproteobacteria bacterium]